MTEVERRQLGGRWSALTCGVTGRRHAQGGSEVSAQMGLIGVADAPVLDRVLALAGRDPAWAAR
jgi:hypothetical protein